MLEEGSRSVTGFLGLPKTVINAAAGNGSAQGLSNGAIGERELAGIRFGGGVALFNDEPLIFE
jgi:hypothetical protein